ncbi:MAG: FMN-binding protein [Oscillospiraceae bacterium]|nr:FMN-binding protein [Oscillospiraceae bacterium]
MSKKNMIMPPVVLACVCAVCCGLLAFANSITKDKIAEAEAQAVQDSLSGLPDAGTFEEITDFTAPEMDKVQANALYADENDMAAVLVTADGYNKGGLQVAVGIDSEGKVTGVSFVSVTETPGLGTKVQSNPELFIDNLIGVSDAEAVQNTDGITGATFSSNGMKNAVKCALQTFELNKEAILG